jgi:hypothetical protein
MELSRAVRRLNPLLFIAAVSFCCIFPKPESLLNLCERATLVTYVLRSLKKDYDDFSKTMGAKTYRRPEGTNVSTPKPGDFPIVGVESRAVMRRARKPSRRRRF